MVVARFLLRIPSDLKRELEEQARLNGRSLNQEIVWRLKRSVDGYSR
jgi:predicted HicB family RNase H-like nuclease